MAATINDLYDEYHERCGNEPPMRSRDELRALWQFAGLRYNAYGTPPSFWLLVFGREGDVDRWADGLPWPAEAQWDAYLEARAAELAGAE